MLCTHVGARMRTHTHAQTYLDDHGARKTKAIRLQSDVKVRKGEWRWDS